MKKRRSNNNLNIHIFNKLSNLFDEKGWDIGEDTGQDKTTLFERFCDLLSRLNEEQQEFIIELTYDYQIIDFNKYTDLINSILCEMYTTLDYMKDLKSIFIMPLVSEENKNKIKSSTLVAYLFQTPLLKYNKKISKLSFKVRNELTDNEINRINESPKTILLLVDDFIGTGETALSAFEYYKGLGIKKEKIIICSIVSQKIGYDLLTQNGILVFYGELHNRALTDKFKDYELEEKLKIMQSIERIISPHEDYKFGYKSSEALVTLVRTPNNTFPIYWLEKSKGPKVPFPRGE